MGQFADVMKHEILSFETLDSRYSGTDLKIFDWSPICSPFNIWCGEKLRTQMRAHVPSENKIATDLIVWGRGEPSNLALTKVGGSPVWSSADDHPRDLSYFGQVCLVDSLSMVQELNGDIVSIWGDEKFPYGKISAFLLDSRRLTHVPEAKSVAVVANKEPFYGALYRSFDVRREFWENLGQIEIEDELGSRRFRFMPWKGSKIAGISSDWDEKSRGDFMLQIMSIQGHPEQPYPWVNVEGELQTSGGSSNSYTADKNSVMIGDMGFITVVVKDGSIHAKFAS